MELIIYSKHDCVYCKLAKALCNKNKIKYEELNYKELTALSGSYPAGVKFPQIYIKNDCNRTHLGGYMDLEEYIRPHYDYENLKNTAKHLTNNLNNIIDYNYYPTKETRTRQVGPYVLPRAVRLFLVKKIFDVFLNRLQI